MKKKTKTILITSIVLVVLGALIFSLVMIFSVLLTYLGSPGSSMEESYQEDADKIRIKHVSQMVDLIEEYKKIKGHYPLADAYKKFEGSDSDALQAVYNSKGAVPVEVIITSREDDFDSPRISFDIDETVKMVVSRDKFLNELKVVLGEGVNLPDDPQKVRNNQRPNHYKYEYHRDDYVLTAYLYGEHPHAEKIQKYFHKYEVTNFIDPRKIDFDNEIEIKVDCGNKNCKDEPSQCSNVCEEELLKIGYLSTFYRKDEVENCRCKGVKSYDELIENKKKRFRLKEAIESINLKRCDEFEKQKLKDACYERIGCILKDKNTCRRIEAESGESSQDSCLISIIKQENDMELCEKLNAEVGHSSQRECYEHFAITNKDPEVCNKVKSDTFKNVCFFGMAIYLKDVSVCEKLKKTTGGFSKENCLNEIEKINTN